MKMVLLLALTALLLGCKGPYKDLEGDFAASDAKGGGTQVSTNYITLVSQNQTGAFNYKGVLEVTVSDDAVTFAPRTPYSIFQKAIRIPSTAITGCSMTCFGMDDRHVDLLLGKQGTDISLDAPKAMLDWCWRTNRPMITGKQKRDWLYAGKELPDIKDHLQVARDEYERQACRACAGY